ncbi:MAG: hypothetical protein D3908_13585 [Candidatus Electrothrix sp. AUS4]|nr:hypothetical protein [Candidatus Electrothrix sp. AUS4]
MRGNRRFFFFLLIVSLLGGCAAPPTEMTSEPYIPKTYGSGSVLAVWDLENFSITENQILDDMQEFLTAKVTETLKEQGGYVVIERQKLLLALEELSLGSSELADENSRLEIGRLIGAQLMVFGGYQQVGEQLRIDLRMVEVESGAVVRTAEHTAATAGDVAGVLAAAEAVAKELL